jgi:hypothetical protein
MKFTYQGVEYRIEFQYDTKKTGKTKVRNYTFARLKTGTQDTERIVAEGRVARYQYDKFDKETARKYALAAALKDSVIGPLFVDEKGFFKMDDLRGFRCAARTAYHRRPGGLGFRVPQTATAATAK